MANDFANVGIHVDSKDDVINFVNKHAEKAMFGENSLGAYALLPMGENIELWFYGDKRGVDPLTAEIFHRAEQSLAAVAHGWQRFDEEHNNSALVQMTLQDSTVNFPLNVELVDGFAWRDEENKPAEMMGRCKLNMTLFAHALEINRNKRTEERLSDESVIPCGTFPLEENDPDWQPSATAVVSGIIEKAELLVNPLTGLKYWNIKLKCLGNIFEVVASTEHFRGDVKPGYVLSGTFWISGKIEV